MLYEKLYPTITRVLETHIAAGSIHLYYLLIIDCWLKFFYFPAVIDGIKTPIYEVSLYIRS